MAFSGPRLSMDGVYEKPDYSYHSFNFKIENDKVIFYRNNSFLNGEDKVGQPYILLTMEIDNKTNWAINPKIVGDKQCYTLSRKDDKFIALINRIYFVMKSSDEAYLFSFEKN